LLDPSLHIFKHEDIQGERRYSSNYS
jgi:hypothetical protein